MMQQLLSKGLWQEIKRIGISAKRKRAAVGYVTEDVIVKFGAGDILVVDASNQRIANGDTDAKVLERALKRGAKIFSLKDLHSKVFLFDSIAIISSANISENSRNRLIEAGLITDDRALANEAMAFIESAKWNPKAIEVDDEFIRRIKKIKVVRTGGGNGGGKTPRIPDPGIRSWIVCNEIIEWSENQLAEGKKGRKEAEKKKIHTTSGINEFRTFGNDSFTRNAKPGDSVLQVLFGKNKKNGNAHRPAGILHRRNTKVGTFIYLEVPRNYEKDVIPYGKFKVFARQYGVKNLTPQTYRSIRKDVEEDIYKNWGK